MGVEYTWGVGYGIAVPLDDDGEERLIEVLNNHFGTDVDQEDGLWEFDGLEAVTETGLEINWVGNAWSGTDQHALILVKGAGNSGNMNEAAGVRMLDPGVPANTAIVSLMHRLLGAKIGFHGPGWMAYGSVI